jgi:RHS repeat-associated protein
MGRTSTPAAMKGGRNKTCKAEGGTHRRDERIGTSNASAMMAGSVTLHADDDQFRKFTGKERDAETGLDFFGARYLSSAQGRFTSPDLPFADWDPSDPQSWNLFAYVRSNPLSFVDPTGRACVVGPDGKESDDKSGGQSCADAHKENENNKPSATVTAQQQSVWAFLTAPQVPRYVPNDKELPENASKIITLAYDRTAHDLGCARLGFAAGDAGGALFVPGQPNAGFRSPVSGKLVGGSKPFASGGASAGSSTLSGALRDALPQTLPGQVPTPVGGLGTGRAFSMQGSNRLGVVLGRWAPFVGAAATAYGAYSLNACLSQ